MDILDLQGLLGENLLLYNRVMESYYLKMAQMITITKIDCSVTINDIQFQNSHNCHLFIKNKCTANSKNNLNILLTCLIEQKDIIDEKTKKQLEQDLGIDFDSANIDDSMMVKKCKISADVSNNIRIQKLSVKNCTSNTPLNFMFYNTGDASVNCGTVEIINSLSNTNIIEKQDVELISFLFITPKQWMYIFLFIFLFLLIIYFIICCTVKPQIYKYTYETNI